MLQEKQNTAYLLKDIILNSHPGVSEHPRVPDRSQALWAEQLRTKFSEDICCKVFSIVTPNSCLSSKEFLYSTIQILLSCSLAESKSLLTTSIQTKTFHLEPKVHMQLTSVFSGDRNTNKDVAGFSCERNTYTLEQLYLENQCILLYVNYTSIKI